MALIGTCVKTQVERMCVFFFGAGRQTSYTLRQVFPTIEFDVLTAQILQHLSVGYCMTFPDPKSMCMSIDD
jgi:hypothetical protein